MYQSNSNGYVAFKKQVAKGTQASGGAALILPTSGGAGAIPTRASVNSKTIRRDGMMKRGGLGTNKLTAAYDSEVYLGNASYGHVETILEAVLRDTFEAAALNLSEADFTSLAITGGVITFGANDPRAKGLRVGDVFHMTNLATAGNNNKNCRITALSGTSITTPVADGLVDEIADTACNIIRPKKLTQFAGGALIPRYFTVEEYEADMDQSEVSTDVVFSGFKFAMQADGSITFSANAVGTGKFDTLATGASPLFAAPVDPIGAPLFVVDATIRVKGVDVVELTNFELTGDIGGVAPATFGSGAQKYSPDVFTGPLGLGLNITALRKDLIATQDFAAGTQYDLHVLMARAGDPDPANFLSLYVGNFLLGGVVKSALSQQAGARSNQLTVSPALVGIDDRGTGFDPTMVKFQSSGL